MEGTFNLEGSNSREDTCEAAVLADLTIPSADDLLVGFLFEASIDGVCLALGVDRIINLDKPSPQFAHKEKLRHRS